MPAVESYMLELGTQAPDFSLPNFNLNYPDSPVSLSSFDNAQGAIVAFICNHCPFVIHIKPEFTRFAREYRQKGLAVIAINSNDATSYPADSPQSMSQESSKYGYNFPYLYDESQEVAKAYRAACTPDFYLFDSDLKLVYRGQFDDSRPGNGIEVSGVDLQVACDSLLNGQTVSRDQKPSIGCSIKWK